VRPRSWFALILVALTGAGCTPMDDLLVSIFGRSMRDQPSILPYQNPQLPPVGSVPFAAGNFPAAAGEYGINQTEGVAIPVPITNLMVLQATENPEAFPDVAGFPNPVAADAASLARGEELYNRACVACHGAEGAGNGTVVAAGVPSRSIVAPESLAYTDAYLYSIIRVGRGAMPAYGHQVSHFDRWHVVNYVRQLQGMLPAQTGAGMAPSDNAAPATDGDAPDA
jgi:mono/diheme cytochrome c family protein